MFISLKLKLSSHTKQTEQQQQLIELSSVTFGWLLLVDTTNRRVNLSAGKIHDYHISRKAYIINLRRVFNSRSVLVYKTPDTFAVRQKRFYQNLRKSKQQQQNIPYMPYF